MNKAPYATLHTDPEPWVADCAENTAVITTETLYFPLVVEQLVLAAKSGAKVYAINHFYPPVVGKKTITFDGHCEATSVVTNTDQGLRLEYLVAGNTKSYNSKLPPYCQRHETNI